MQWKPRRAAIETRPSLRAAIERAIARAAYRSRPIVMACEQTVADIDPLAFLHAHGRPTSHRFYWEQPSQGFALAAAGAIAARSTQAATRFRDVQWFAADYLADAIAVDTDGNASPTGAFGLGGFAFRPSELGAAIADLFPLPGGLLFVPHWVLRRSLAEGKTTLILHALVGASDRADAIEASLHEAFADLAFPIGSLPPYNNCGSARIAEVRGDRPWTESVCQAVASIERGELEKIVLARALDIHTTAPIDPLAVARSLRENYPDCTTFCLDLGRGTAFVGATPEMLLQFRSERSHLWLYSDALAGSSRRGSTEREDAIVSADLLKSAKDLHEHAIVIRSILRALTDLGAIPEAVDAPHLLKLSNVQHLHTSIRAKLADASWLAAFDAIAQLHPTAAVGGEPRPRALSLMQQWEACDRGWYAAPIGWVNSSGEGTFAVGIRSGYVRGTRARLFAGAGIVAASQIDAELLETRLKFAPLLHALGVARDTMVF